MKDFLKIGKDLQIKEIKDEPEEAQSSLKTHIESVHEDVKYPCSLKAMILNTNYRCI